MVMTKTNSMGNAIKPKETPMQRLSKQTEKQVGVLYGHEGSGKVYDYLAKDTVRTGDIVTPMVTHAKTGKTYKTLARVVRTRDSLSPASARVAGELSGQGIMLKTIGKTNQRSLPGYYTDWGKDAKAAKELYDTARLDGASQSELDSIKGFTNRVRREDKEKYDKMHKLNTLGKPIK